jgi:hypothetical protein
LEILHQRRDMPGDPAPAGRLMASRGTRPGSAHPNRTAHDISRESDSVTECTDSATSLTRFLQPALERFSDVVAVQVAHVAR